MANHLALMGIPVWQERAPQNDSSLRALQGRSNLPNTRLVVVYLTSEANEPLLNRILSALSFTASSVHIVSVDKPEALRNIVWPDSPVVVFGEGLAEWAPMQAIQSCSLISLEQDVQAKKALWQQLKTL